MRLGVRAKHVRTQGVRNGRFLHSYAVDLKKDDHSKKVFALFQEWKLNELSEYAFEMSGAGAEEEGATEMEKMESEVDRESADSEVPSVVIIVTSPTVTPSVTEGTVAYQRFQKSMVFTVVPENS